LDSFVELFIPDLRKSCKINNIGPYKIRKKIYKINIDVSDKGEALKNKKTNKKNLVNMNVP